MKTKHINNLETITEWLDNLCLKFTNVNQGKKVSLQTLGNLKVFIIYSDVKIYFGTERKRIEGLHKFDYGIF